MRALAAINRIKFLAVFSLLLITGCAQNTYSVKDAKVDAVETATLRDISILGSGNETRIEIVADKPLTFTSYVTKDPKRTIIDLSQADLGAVTAPRVDEGSAINKIEVTKNELTTGSLVRITIDAKDTVDLLANTDPADNRKIIITTLNTISSGNAGLRQDNSAEKTLDKEPVVKLSATEGTVSKEVKKNELLPENKSDKDVSNRYSGKATITDINILTDGILIKTEGNIANIRQFTLEKPQRLVLDLFDAKSVMKSKIVKVNTMGVKDLRIGEYPDKVRIVLDSRRNTFPKYNIDSSDNGIKIVLSQNEPRVDKEKITENKESVQRTERTDVQEKENSTVEAIDFKQMDGYSRISITTKGSCEPAQPQKTRSGYVLTINNCLLPRNLQKPFDTVGFDTGIKKLTFYQSKNRGRFDTKVLIALRNTVPVNVKQEGPVIIIDVKNDEASSMKWIQNEKVVKERREKLAENRNEMSAKQIRQQRSRETVHDALHFGASDRKSDKKNYSGKRVTLEFVDADIRKIFQLIAEVSNLNILVGDEVSGTITIKLANVPWDQALDVILETKGLGMKREGNVVLIRPKGKLTSLADDEIAARKAYEKTLEINTKVFDCNYADVKDVEKNFANFKTERGTITTDPRTNRVIVNDVNPALNRMEALLKELDIPEKQVLIEARIVEASTTFSQDLGIQWGIHYRDDNPAPMGLRALDTNFGGIVGQTPNTTYPVINANTGLQDALQAGSTLGMVFGRLASNVQLNLRIAAAAEDGLVKIISTPKVVTLNNKSAKITQGQMIPYATVSAEGTKVEFIEAALTLEVTPHITPSGAISLKIKASNNSPGAAAAGLAPPINKKEATTELLLSNGETTVIGGIYVDRDENTDSGVPGVKDIPVLGWLFKSHNVLKTKTELLIFITPKIVN